MKTKNIPLSLIIITILLSTTPTLKAGLSYNFSFTGDDLSYPYSPGATETIGGIITLNDAGTAATSVYVTSNSGGALFDSSFNYVDDNYLQVIDKGPAQRNVFTVVNGIITGANFGSTQVILELKDGPAGLGYYQYTNSLQFSPSEGGRNMFMFGSMSNYSTMNFTSNNSGSSGVTFSAIAVPEPSTYGLIGIGALGVAFAARRRKIK